MKLSFPLVIVFMLALAGCAWHPPRQTPGHMQAAATHDTHSATTVTHSFRPYVVEAAITVSGATSQPSPVAAIPQLPVIIYVPETTTTTQADGHLAVTGAAVNDENPLGPLTLNLPGITAATGGAQAAPKQDAALLGLNDSAKLGGTILLGLGAVVLLVSVIPYTKAIVPIPVWVGPALAAGGIVCYVMPVWIDRYSWVLWLFGVVVAAGALVHLAITHGWLKQQVAAGGVVAAGGK